MQQRHAALEPGLHRRLAGGREADGAEFLRRWMRMVFFIRGEQRAGEGECKNRGGKMRVHRDPLLRVPERRYISAVSAETPVPQLWRRLSGRVRVLDMSRCKIGFALPLCLALAACAPKQDVRLLIQPSESLAADCL